MHNDVSGSGGNAIPFDTVDWDSDGFWDPVTFKFVVPAGKAGLYKVSFLVYVAADAAITSVMWIVEGNDPDLVLGGGFDFLGVKYAQNGSWIGSGTCDIYGHEGDLIFVDGGANGADAVVTAGSYMSLVYLGAPTLLP